MFLLQVLVNLVKVVHKVNTVRQQGMELRPVLCALLVYMDRRTMHNQVVAIVNLVVREHMQQLQVRNPVMIVLQVTFLLPVGSRHAPHALQGNMLQLADLNVVSV